MTSPQAVKVPLGIWFAAIFGLILILILASLLLNQEKKRERVDNERSRSQFSFEVERLQKIGDSGLAVVGTSLTKCAFPFDAELNTLAGEKGVSIKFVRFSRNGLLGKDFPIRQNYRTVMPELLRSHPRWVFLQAETFFLGLVAKTEESRKRFSIPKWNEILHTHLHFLFRKAIDRLYANFSESGNLKSDVSSRPRAKETQSDGDMFSDAVGRERHMIQDSSWDIIIHPPVFPDYMEDFINEAKEAGIEVVLLEMNRSKAGNDYYGESFRAQLTNTLQEVSSKYRIPYWQFKGDLSLDYFTDWAHLNQRGRAVFTEWFLEKFVQEYGHERL